MKLIFAIYYKGICHYIGYTENLPRRLRQFSSIAFYNNKIKKRDASDEFIEFLKFYQEKSSYCKVLILEKDLELSESIMKKKEYIRTFKPKYNLLDS